MPAAASGIGIFEIARMERAISRHPSLVRKVFTDEERRTCEGAMRPAEHYAARFAARRAVLRALGCQDDPEVRRFDVSVRAGDNGRPTAVLSGKAQQVAAARGVTEIALSLSFTHEVATAMALLVTDDVRPKPKEERDPQRELLASFRQARTVLDELDRLQGDVADALA